MSRITAARPADYATVIGPRLHNVFYPGEPLTFTLSTAGATTYTVRDYTGTVIDSGSVSGTTLTLPTAPYAGRYGWWRLQLSGTDAGDGAYGTDKGTCSFCIFSDNAAYPEDPLRTSNPANTTQGQTDGILHGVLGAGMLRRTCDVKIGEIRQGATAYVASGTSVTATLTTYTGGDTTSESMLWAVHVFNAADHTGLTVPTGWTLAGSQTFNNLIVRVFYLFGAQNPGTITLASTASGEHSLMIEEIVWSEDEAPYIAPVFATGTGTAAATSVDSSALATEQYVLTAAAVGAASGAISQNGLTSYRGVSDGSGNEKLLVTEDTFGSGAARSASYSWTGSSDWITVYLVARIQDQFATNVADTAADLGVMDTWYHAYADGVRTRPKHVQSPNGTVGYEAKITQMVADLAADGHSGVYFEGRNEPQASYPVSEVSAFATAVHAASGKAVSSGFVSLCDYSLGLANFESELDAGMAASVDAIGFHDYNMCDGDLRNGIRLYEAVAAALSSRGTGVPMLMTEGGFETSWGGWGGANPPSLCKTHDAGAAFMKHLLLKEIVLGVTPEQTFYFYDMRGGFDSVVTWQASAAGIYSGYAMLRTFTENVRGKTLETRFDFGDGRYHYLGGIWSAPSRTGAKVAVVVADSAGLDPLTFYCSGDPSTVTVCDCFGNATSVSPLNGVFSLTITDTPQYVEIPDGASFDVRPPKWGLDALPVQNSPQITNDVDSGATGMTLGKMIDGDPRSCYYYDSGDNTTHGSVYVDETGTFPKTVTISFPFTATKVTRLMVETPVPWQDTQGVLLDFDVEYQRVSDSVWVTAKTFTHAATVTVKNYSYDDDTMYDCYSQPQTVWIADLGAETAIKGVRLVVRDASAGMYLDATMLGAYTLTKRTTLREVTARNAVTAAAPLLLP